MSVLQNVMVGVGGIGFAAICFLGGPLAFIWLDRVSHTQQIRKRAAETAVSR
jgi:hypothetical protein